MESRGQEPRALYLNEVRDTSLLDTQIKGVRDPIKGVRDPQAAYGEADEPCSG